MDSSFQEEDVALLLSEDILKVMFQLLNGYQSSMEIQKIVNQINTSLISQNCSLYFKTYRTDWSYECEYSFPIKKVFLGEQVKIITANRDFPTFFVSKVLHFQSLEIGDESKVPWTLYHERILRLFPDHNASFLASFLKDPRFDSYTVALRKEDSLMGIRVLALPIFAVVMYLMYSLSMGTSIADGGWALGTFATDWTNDVLFGEMVPNALGGFLESIGVAGSGRSYSCSAGTVRSS